MNLQIDIIRVHPLGVTQLSPRVMQLRLEAKSSPLAWFTHIIHTMDPVSPAMEGHLLCTRPKFGIAIIDHSACSGNIMEVRVLR